MTSTHLRSTAIFLFAGIHITSRSFHAAWWNCVLLCMDSNMLFFFDQVRTCRRYIEDSAAQLADQGPVSGKMSLRIARFIRRPASAVLWSFPGLRMCACGRHQTMRNAKLSCISSILLHPPRHEFTMKSPRWQASFMASSCGTPLIRYKDIYIYIYIYSFGVILIHILANSSLSCSCGFRHSVWASLAR